MRHLLCDIEIPSQLGSGTGIYLKPTDFTHDKGHLAVQLQYQKVYSLLSVSR